jgi:excinuclease ABC subunit C
VRAALKLLPHKPGVYIFRNRTGRVIYIGRSRDLATRARSYWIDLGDRPHLRRLVEQVAWVEPVLCVSEHEAAFLEIDLLARHPTHYNRTLGMESRVWLRLDPNPRKPALDVVHDLVTGDGAHWFGPYLGWEPTRQAAAGLRRLFPLRLAGTAISRSDSELARSKCVTAADRTALLRRIESVLRRDDAAVRGAIRDLQRMQDVAAERLMFEYAASLREQVRGLRWICEPQKFDLPGATDADYGAVGRSGSIVLLVVLALRGGRLLQRHVDNAPPTSDSWQNPTAHEEWEEQAHRNAELMASLAAGGALGPLGWRVAQPTD